MKKLLLGLLFLSVLACKDDFSEEKYNVKLDVTNRTEKVIPIIKVDGANGAKTWLFKNVSPGQTESVLFNIKDDFKTPEGGIILTAFLSKSDSISLNTGYFTNYQYQGPKPSSFGVYDTKIEVDQK